MDIIIGYKNKKNKNYNYLICQKINCNNNLHLSLINNVFSDEECCNLIIHSEKIGYVQASSYTDKYKKEHYFLEIRKSLRCIVDDINFAKILYKRIAHIIPINYKDMTFCEINPRFRFLKYTSGDHFAKHTDEHYKNDKNEISLITVLIYINDDYEGGNTKFLIDDKNENDISIIPKIGLICLMDQNILHEVPKLISGIKYVIRTELMYN